MPGGEADDRRVELVGLAEMDDVVGRDLHIVGVGCELPDAGSVCGVHGAHETMVGMAEPAGVHHEQWASHAAERPGVIQTLVETTVDEGACKVGIELRERFEQHAQGPGEKGNVDRLAGVPLLAAAEEDRHFPQQPARSPSARLRADLRTVLQG